MQQKFKVISCEILSRELYYCAALSQNIIDITILDKGLHDIGATIMRERIQAEIDKVDSDKYDAIILCYGLCNNGIIGLSANLTLVVPKAHDCITLMLGSRKIYNEYFNANSGTYYKSPGWIERDSNPNDVQNSVTQNMGLGMEYVDEDYDEETMAFLEQSLGNWMQNYNKFTYIETGVGDQTYLIDITKKQAETENYDFEVVQGKLNLIMDLLNGNWNDDFLIVPKGEEIINSYDDNIIKRGNTG